MDHVPVVDPDVDKVEGPRRRSKILGPGPKKPSRKVGDSSLRDSRLRPKSNGGTQVEYGPLGQTRTRGGNSKIGSREGLKDGTSEVRGRSLRCRLYISVEVTVGGNTFQFRED